MAASEALTLTRTLTLSLSLRLSLTLTLTLTLTLIGGVRLQVRNKDTASCRLRLLATGKVRATAQAAAPIDPEWICRMLGLITGRW